MAFMTFSVLDLLRVSWLFMQAGLRPNNLLTLKQKNRQSKTNQTKTEDEHETIVKRSKMA